MVPAADNEKQSLSRAWGAPASTAWSSICRTCRIRKPSSWPGGRSPVCGSPPPLG